MVDKEQIERWRQALSGRDPLKFVNTLGTVAQSKSPEAVELLENAGEFLPANFWDMQIELHDRTVTVREFRDEWLRQLRESLPYAFRAGELDAAEPVAFISYSTTDQVRATQLAGAITQGAGHQVFLDHWELAPGDQLPDRIAASIERAGALVLLVSKSSLASAWVKKEMKLAFSRAKQDPRFRIIPVLLESLKAPKSISDLVYVDWREPDNIDLVAQTVLDRIRGRPSFSARVSSLMSARDSDNHPYQEQHRQVGRNLLPFVASVSELTVEANQQWLMWRLFHDVLPAYRCTIKIGRGTRADTVQFDLVDRWFETVNTIALTEEEMQRGLWSVAVDPTRTERWGANDLRHLGDTGRISFRSSCSPRTEENPFLPTRPDRLDAILSEINASMRPWDSPAKESFLYALCSAADMPRWRRVEIVFGGVHTTLSLAFSSMVRDVPERETGGPGVTMELWDPFFGSMKSTELFRSQLGVRWEADVDLLSRQWETLLGPE